MRKYVKLTVEADNTNDLIALLDEVQEKLKQGYTFSGGSVYWKVEDKLELDD